MIALWWWVYVVLLCRHWIVFTKPNIEINKHFSGIYAFLSPPRSLRGRRRRNQLLPPFEGFNVLSHHLLVLLQLAVHPAPQTGLARLVRPYSGQIRPYLRTTPVERDCKWPKPLSCILSRVRRVGRAAPLQCVATRETEGGWPLLTFET